jgi:hypothetical protein
MRGKWLESRLHGLNRGRKLGVQIRQDWVDLRVVLGAVHYRKDLISLGGSNPGFQYSETTNKMQRYTIFLIVVSAVHVSSGFSAHHQELKNYTCSIGYLSDSPTLPVAATSMSSIRCCMYSFWAPDVERRNRSKHVQHWQQYRISYNAASCWLCLRIHWRCSVTWKLKTLNPVFRLPSP